MPLASFLSLKRGERREERGEGREEEERREKREDRREKSLVLEESLGGA